MNAETKITAETQNERTTREIDVLMESLKEWRHWLQTAETRALARLNDDICLRLHTDAQRLAEIASGEARQAAETLFEIEVR